MPANADLAPPLKDTLEAHQMEITAAWAGLIAQLPFVFARTLPPETITLWAGDLLKALIEIAQPEGEITLHPPLDSARLALFENQLEVGELVEVLLLGKDAVYPHLHSHPDQTHHFDQVLRRTAHFYSQAYATLYRSLEKQAIWEERVRLAREFHDTVAQSLYSVSLYVEATLRAFQTGNTEGAASYLREVATTSQEALREMRLLIFDLRPPALEREGLISVLRARLEAVESRAGFKPTLSVEGQPALALSVQEELYRIVQEALNNILKHANAHHVDLKLCFRGRGVWLEVYDDGVGFDPSHPQGGLGLKGIEERIKRLGGTLSIKSAPDQGTRIGVTLPDQDAGFFGCDGLS